MGLIVLLAFAAVVFLFFIGLMSQQTGTDDAAQPLTGWDLAIA